MTKLSVYDSMAKVKVLITIGDIINQQDSDAIVNSANPTMLAGSGVINKFSLPLLVVHN